MINNPAKKIVITSILALQVRGDFPFSRPQILDEALKNLNDIPSIHQPAMQRDMERYLTQLFKSPFFIQVSSNPCRYFATDRGLQFLVDIGRYSSSPSDASLAVRDLKCPWNFSKSFSSLWRHHGYMASFLANGLSLAYDDLTGEYHFPEKRRVFECVSLEEIDRWEFL